MKIIPEIIFYFITLYVLFSVMYVFLFAVASKFRKLPARSYTNANGYKCLLLIPAYKEDIVILEVAEKAMQLNYPADKYEVVVIADQLKAETIRKLKSIPVKVLEVQFEKSTKAKALNAALDLYEISEFDIAYVIDADNIMEPDFMVKINEAFLRGYRAVQGHRISKNDDTPVSLLDSISEEINNNVFRQGHRALDISSAFIGSGLAVEFELFKNLMKKVTSVGEDKELEMLLLKQRIKIEYIPDAIVYDEKIQDYSNMVNQRRRWLYAQFDFLKRYFFNALLHLFKGNVDYFDKVIQQALIPRSLLIGLIALYFVVLTVVGIAGYSTGNVMLAEVWTGMAVLLVLSLFFAIPGRYYTFRTLIAILYLPKGIMVMFISLVKSWFSGNTFFHTKHGAGKV